MPRVYVAAYPGEIFQVPVVTVGQRDGTVPSTVRSTIENTQLEVDLLESQYLQQVSNTCTKLTYNVFSLSQSVYIQLQTESDPCSKLYYSYTLDYNSLQIEVGLSQRCPPGFNFSVLARACVCETRLTKYTHHCNITNGLGHITHDSGQQFWVGYDSQSDGLILHVSLHDYCVSHSDHCSQQHRHSYEEISDISLFFTLILTFSCCSLSMANTGDEVIYRHYFDFVNFYKKV